MLQFMRANSIGLVFVSFFNRLMAIDELNKSFKVKDIKMSSDKVTVNNIIIFCDNQWPQTDIKVITASSFGFLSISR
jgi:hypothetical protein